MAPRPMSPTRRRLRKMERRRRQHLPANTSAPSCSCTAPDGRPGAATPVFRDHGDKCRLLRRPDVAGDRHHVRVQAFTGCTSSESKVANAARTYPMLRRHLVPLPGSGETCCASSFDEFSSVAICAISNGSCATDRRRFPGVRPRRSPVRQRRSELRAVPRDGVGTTSRAAPPLPAKAAGPPTTIARTSRTKDARVSTMVRIFMPIRVSNGRRRYRASCARFPPRWDSAWRLSLVQQERGFEDEREGRPGVPRVVAASVFQRATCRRGRGGEDAKRPLRSDPRVVSTEERAGKSKGTPR